VSGERILIQPCAGQKQVRSTLVEDKQIPDTNFKALATGVFGYPWKKAAGKAGGALADKVAKCAKSGELGDARGRQAVLPRKTLLPSRKLLLR
jgi:hypothetical protein